MISHVSQDALPRRGSAARTVGRLRESGQVIP
jgi:hypothetical protein